MTRRRLAAVFGVVVAMLVAAPASASAPDIQIVFPQDTSATFFTPTYGYPKPDGRKHLGIDLHAPKMTPVYAADDGIVTYVGSGENAGNFLIIEHGDGWETWYLHLNNDTPGTDDGAAKRSYVLAPGIEAGAFVVGGQHIGYVGDSGNAEATYPHTHFELHYRGSPVNPYRYLDVAFERARQIAVAEVFRMLGPAEKAQIAASSSPATILAISSWLNPDAAIEWHSGVVSMPSVSIQIALWTPVIA